jgi:hypothetical protein
VLVDRIESVAAVCARFASEILDVCIDRQDERNALSAVDHFGCPLGLEPPYAPSKGLAENLDDRLGWPTDQGRVRPASIELAHDVAGIRAPARPSYRYLYCVTIITENRAAS